MPPVAPAQDHVPVHPGKQRGLHPVERGKVLLAEFCYDGKVVSTLPLDPTRSRRLYWWMKTALFPWMYWHVILRGRDWRHPAHTPHDG